MLSLHAPYPLIDAPAISSDGVLYTQCLSAVWAPTQPLEVMCERCTSWVLGDLRRALASSRFGVAGLQNGSNVAEIDTAIGGTWRYVLRPRKYTFWLIYGLCGIQR